MLGAIDGSARSIDRAARTMDPSLAQASIDGAARSMDEDFFVEDLMSKRLYIFFSE